jgi:hypothetical protein
MADRNGEFLYQKKTIYIISLSERLMEGHTKNIALLTNIDLYMIEKSAQLIISVYF